MPTTFLPPAMLAAALALAASPGHATSVASTTLADFLITVRDLAPADAITPSVTFDPLSRSIASAGAVAPGANAFWMNQGTGVFGPVSASGILDGEGTGGAASFAGDPFGAGAGGGATLVASAVGASTFVGGVGQVYFDTQPSGLTRLTLSAHTQLSFAGVATMAWNASDPRAGAWGSASMGFVRDLDTGPEIVAQDAFEAGWIETAGVGTLAGTASDGLSIVFANTSDDAIVLDWYVNVFANANEIDVAPPAVAEPSRLALLLAGALPAWLAGRRRHRRAGSLPISAGSGACR